MDMLNFLRNMKRKIRENMTKHESLNTNNLRYSQCKFELFRQQSFQLGYFYQSTHFTIYFCLLLFMVKLM